MNIVCILQVLYFSMYRRHLGQTVYNLITTSGFPASLVFPLLSEQRAIWPQETYRVEKMTEIIADIQYSGLSESATNESCLANLSYIELKVHHFLYIYGYIELLARHFDLSASLLSWSLHIVQFHLLDIHCIYQNMSCMTGYFHTTEILGVSEFFLNV